MERAERRSVRFSLLLCLLSVATASAQGETKNVARQLTGRVYDENGKPIAGAAVGVFESQAFVDTAALLAHPPTVTGKDGTYTVALDAAIRWGEVVVAAARRQACAIRAPYEMEEAVVKMSDALLLPGASLVGRVRDDRGAALAGVRIRIEGSINERTMTNAHLLAGAVTDGKGIFTVPCVPRTGMKLVAEANGYLTESRIVAQQSPVDLTMRQVGMVRGKVVDAAGAPVRDIDVYGVTVERREDSHVRTAADGTFAITVPKQGRFRLSGSEPKPPYRQFSSELLRGPGVDVVVRVWTGDAPGARTCDVVVVDAATKAPIPKFRLSQQQTTNLQSAMFHHPLARRAYEGTAHLELRPPGNFPWALVVDAPEHGFELIPVPDDLSKPLVVELGPEAVLNGCVTDAETGLPIAGVAVRALPNGTGGGAGGRAEDAGPLTDAKGNYRVTGLRPGPYGVQVHLADRPPSQVVSVTVKVGSDNMLDLVVPKRRWLEVEVKGELPAGPPCTLTTSGIVTSSGGNGGFAHYVRGESALSIAKAGTFKLGPVGNGSFPLQLWVPSRVRIGAGTTLQLGTFDAGMHSIELPDLTMQIVHGHVDLPSTVPTERIATLATVVPGPKQNPWRVGGENPNVAGLDADGNFELDLPVGSYYLQLADVLTGIVFHTEEADVVVGKGLKPLALHPAIHWLAIDLVPEKVGDEVVLLGFGVTLPRPRNGACAALLTGGNASNQTERGFVPFRPGITARPWLVPPAHIVVEALQTFEVLQPWSQGYQSKVVASEAVDVEKAEHRITMTIPGPPTDEELMRRKD